MQMKNVLNSVISAEIYGRTKNPVLYQCRQDKCWRSRDI